MNTKLLQRRNKMTYIGLKSKSDEVNIVFINTEEQKSAEIKLKDFQKLWRALKREANDTKIVFEEPTISNQLSRCASLDFADCLEIYEAKGVIDKSTKFENAAMFVLSDEYVVQFLDLIADREIVITGKELSDELDKINKPTKLRVITE